jgi:hypothetical protein
MHIEDPAWAKNEELQRALEREIARRTWGRIRQLRIELTKGRLTVSGHTSSYYVKQLALAAVRKVYSTVPVDLDIQVIRGSQPCAARA